MTSLTALHDWPVSSVAAAVIGDGWIDETYGDVDAVFELASVTKLLSAYAVLVAIEEGAFELDDPAGPEGSTVRHLLAHASGLAFGDRRVQSPPETKRIYSSAGFEVLAQFTEEKTTFGFADYLQEAVLDPLGMTRTSLPGPAGHGARSTVSDLAAFAGELLNPTLVSGETHAEAVSVQFPGLDGILPGYGSQRPNDWGLGFEIKAEKDPHWTGARNSAATYGHFGQSGTFVWVDPVARRGLVVLTDRDFGEWAKPLWPTLSDSTLPGSPQQ
ncbi:serine hydrolase domain-containing protein [Actinomycetes bacterium M1A6_2h]